MDPNNQSQDQNQEPVVSNQETTNPYAPTAPSTETVTESPMDNQTETEMILAPKDDLMVEEPPVSPTPEESTPQTPMIKNPLQSLTIPEATPMTTSQIESQVTPEETLPEIEQTATPTPETEALEVPLPQTPTPEAPTPEPSTTENQTTQVVTPLPYSSEISDLPQETEAVVKEEKPTSNLLKYGLVGLALILLGILIGVVASNIIPQAPSTPVVPTGNITPTEVITPSVTPEEETPTASLSAVDQEIINKFAGKKTTGGITADLIQKCNYKDSVVYTLSQPTATSSPSIIVNASTKYLMTCGLKGQPSTCDAISMCQQIYKTSVETSYKCPTGEWVDCEPIVEAGRKYQCEQPYLTWAKENCPGFKGAAL